MALGAGLKGTMIGPIEFWSTPTVLRPALLLPLLNRTEIGSCEEEMLLPLLTLRSIARAKVPWQP
jgi:hypothetical protein